MNQRPTDDQQSNIDNTITRRQLTAGTSAAWLSAAVCNQTFAAEPSYRAAVIGHTGRGNYGHGLDTVWKDVPNTQLVAVADADENGRRKAVERLGGIKGFGDYREMLDEVKPDLVSIACRWLDQHRDMVVAAVERGVKGIYLEKPMCRDLKEADEMVAACEKSGTKLAIATQNRYSPTMEVIDNMIKDGKLGRIVEIRARGKDDQRGGGEDLWVLGTHVLDLMRYFGGDVQWCFARVYQDGKPISAGHVRDGNEGIGPLAGNEVDAMYRLSSGVTGHWNSLQDAKGQPTRFGIRVYGTEGVLELHETGYLPQVRYLPESGWAAGRSGKNWIPVSSAGLGKPERLKGHHHEANVAAVKNLIWAIENGSQPKASIYEARKTVEMIAAVFESHRLNRAVDFPLKNRKNPLTMLSK